MSSTFKSTMDGKEWQKYCQNILILHYGRRNFFPVPDTDSGDHGLEFFTTDGTLFQCYFPDPNCSMEEFKKRAQKKINDDLNKLIEYQDGIAELLDGIIINEWVILIPEIRTKDIIKYCNKKAKSFLQKSPPFIDKDNFHIRAHDDDAFPNEKHKARRMLDEEINIPVCEVNHEEKEEWKSSNANFYANLNRKCSKISTNPDRLIDQLIGHYLILEDLLGAYREEFPELHSEISKMVNANLNTLRNNSLFTIGEPGQLMKELLEANRANVDRLTQKISQQNSEAFSIGFISKWIAECNMDFMLS